MAAPIAIFGIKGRYGTDKPFECPEDQVLEALNVDWHRSSLGRKRRGASVLSLAGGTAQTGTIVNLFSHVPGDELEARELWAIDDAVTPRWKRLAGSANWADVLVDDINTEDHISAVSFNGKLFLAYKSAQDRLHCWDPTDNKVRRVGLAQPAAPVVADTGAGAYSPTIRYYQVQYRTKSGSDILRQSNLSAVTTFTPSGAGTAARITKPAAINEGETHWAIYGSPDNGNFVELTELTVATGTYDDTAAPSTYDGDAAPIAGSFSVPPSCSFIVADDSRLVMAGGTNPNRIHWTPPLGASDKGDDERINNTTSIKAYTDVEEAIRGISDPIMGSMYTFSWESQWKLVQTGNVVNPYSKFRIAGGVGLTAHKTIIIAEDESGEPAIYWISPQGPYRRGNAGQQSLLDDVQDIWDRVNLDAAATFHGVYHKDIHQIWWWVAVDGSTTPNERIVFDTKLGRAVEGSRTVRRGWAHHTGESCEASSSVMMSDTVGASMGFQLKPYIGRSTGTAIWMCDDDSTTDDAGTSYQSYIDVRPYSPWGLGQLGGVIEDALLVAKVEDGVTIRLTLEQDFDSTKVHHSSVTLTATTGTRTFPQFGDSRMADANVIKMRVGDEAAVSNTWNLDALLLKQTDMGYR